SLLRNDGLVALPGRRGRCGKVEGVQNLFEISAIHKSVDRTPEIRRETAAGRSKIVHNRRPTTLQNRCSCGEIHGMPPKSQIERAADTEDRIPQRLEFESAHVCAPQQMVEWILSRNLGFFPAVLLPGGGEQDEFGESFDRPPASHETGGEPVQQ